MTVGSIQFAAFMNPFRLQAKRDACGDLVVQGRFGHLYEHGAGVIGIVLEDYADSRTGGRSLRARRRKALAAGMRLHQAGDAESILLFELGNPAQEKLALVLVGAKRRRIPSPAQSDALQRAREAFRFKGSLAQEPIQVAGMHDLRGLDG